MIANMFSLEEHCMWFIQLIVYNHNDKDSAIHSWHNDIWQIMTSVFIFSCLGWWKLLIDFQFLKITKFQHLFFTLQFEEFLRTTFPSLTFLPFTFTIYISVNSKCKVKEGH